MVLNHYTSAEHKLEDLIPSVAQQETQRRQQIARLIYDVWTHCGAEICGLAEPILVDGRLNILSSYVIEYYTDIKEDDCSTCGRKTEIDIVNASSLSPDIFRCNYMYRNLPLIITGLSETWSCCNDWVVEDSTTKRSIPNLSRILECYGKDIVTVHVQPTCGFQRPQQRPETSNTFNMTVTDYITWWNNYKVEDHINGYGEEPLLYLKDWKFVASHPDADIYTCPHFFRDDWLNDAKSNSYKFVYLGRKGTVTALHADVLRSFSWSTNISGSKLWYFIAPQHAHLLYDCFGTKLAHHLHADIASNIDSDTMNDTEYQQSEFLSVLYPGLQFARQYSYSIHQQSGETIFVPSNWFHTVENVEDTLSINHNWLNGANVQKCWQYVDCKVRRSRKHARNEHHALTSNHNGASDLAFTVEDFAEKIDDDVFLLWEVVEKKAKFFIEQMEARLASMYTDDLLSILFVVDGMLNLYKDVELLTSASKELDKVRQLRRVLETLAKTNA